MRTGIAISDTTAGLFLAQGILLALLQRHQTGEGQWVQTSLLQAQIFMLDFQAARWLTEGQVARSLLDRAAMHQSLEVRVPLLDLELVDLAARIEVLPDRLPLVLVFAACSTKQAPTGTADAITVERHTPPLSKPMYATFGCCATPETARARPARACS